MQFDPLQYQARLEALKLAKESMGAVHEEANIEIYAKQVIFIAYQFRRFLTEK